MHLKKLLVGAGIVSSLLGIALGLYVLLADKSTNIRAVIIRGNHRISQDEILFVIKDVVQQEKWNKATIEEMLLMNPRIRDVQLEIKSGGKLVVDIQEKETLYLEQTAEGIREIGPEGEILQEEAEKSHMAAPESELPILYLTKAKDELTMAAALKRDIINLWQKTKKSYAFIWGRLSEFEIAPTDSGSPGLEIRCYPVSMQARIVLKSALDESLLRRLWAILYYMEKYHARSKVVVELYDQNAVLRELAAEAG
ncbi:MAG: FtsQ-type POTRA domain-containing protein [Leptospiraceae bacterium]|nr:FtsQ-type POTRA domain-containing protein [Leptospiraceae bacterium]